MISKVVSFNANAKCNVLQICAKILQNNNLKNIDIVRKKN